MLVNFNVPNSTIATFDAICRYIERSRTSVIVELIERFIIDGGGEQALSRRKLNDLKKAAAEKAEFEPKLDQDYECLLGWSSEFEDPDADDILEWYRESDT